MGEIRLLIGLWKVKWVLLGLDIWFGLQIQNVFSFLRRYVFKIQIETDVFVWHFKMK